MSRCSQVQSPSWASGLSIFPKCFPQMAESVTAPSVLQCDPEVAGRGETALGGEHVPSPPGLEGGKKSPVPPRSAAPGTTHMSPRCPLLSSLALGGASVLPAADTRGSKTPEFSWGVVWLVGTVHGGCHFTRSSGGVMGQGALLLSFHRWHCMASRFSLLALILAPTFRETRGEPACPPSGASHIGPGPLPSHV